MISSLFQEIQKYEIHVLKIIWLFLPAAFANMAPVLAKKVFPDWDKPVDFGFKFHNQPLFGSHKTMRGIVSAVVTGFIIFIIQQTIYARVPWMRYLSLIDYNVFNPLFGAWVGFCAISADLIKSFLKRRLSIPSGSSWIPFDQVDWIVGALLGMSVIIPLHLESVLIALITFTTLDIFVNYISYKLGLKENPY